MNIHNHNLKVIYTSILTAMLLSFSQLIKADVKIGFFIEGATSSNGKYEEKFDRSKLKVKGDSDYSNIAAGFALDTGKGNLPLFSYRLNAGLALGYLEKSANKFNGQKAPYKSGLAANCQLIDANNPYSSRRNRSNWRKQHDFCVDVGKGKDRYTTTGFHSTHDLTFAIFRNEQIRLWLAPSILIAYTVGLHHSDSDLSYYTFDFGVGPTVGLDILNSQDHTLAIKFGAKNVYHIGKMNYAYGRNSDADIRSRDTQAFLNFSILY